jgi:hypothetical protein
MLVDGPPIAAQFMGDNLIGLFDFLKNEEGVKVVSERHYRLVPATELSEEELKAYQLGPL